MKHTRRNFLQGAVGIGAGALASGDLAAARARADADRRRGLSSARDAFRAVLTPDVPDLAFEMDGDVRVFHLVAEPVQQEIFPGKILDLWGYNGSAPGPTIQARQGERVRIVVDNHLPEPTSMHWHGFDIPFEMDGGPGLSQDAISPGGRYVYEFTLQQEGTLFYHSHMAMQEMMGMIGAFIMHPAEAYDPPAEKDFAIILQEYAVLPNNPTPNSMSMEFNWLTLNGKSGPANTPLIVRLGDRVRLRFINLGMDHHPIHMHGHQFVITGTEGRTTAACYLGAEQHGAGGSGAIAQCGICGDESGRLDDSLSHATSHDESDVIDGRADDAPRGNACGRGDGARHGDYERRCGDGGGKWSEHGPRHGCWICTDAADFERRNDVAVVGAVASFAARRARDGRDADGAGGR